jgi:hypothetical protein
MILRNHSNWTVDQFLSISISPTSAGIAQIGTGNVLLITEEWTNKIHKRAMPAPPKAWVIAKCDGDG